MIEETKFAELYGVDIIKYTLENQNGFSVTVMNSSQNKQIRLVDSKSSETAISGTNIKVGGEVPTGTITVPSGLEEFYLYIYNTSTGITKLILTYE